MYFVGFCPLEIVHETGFIGVQPKSLSHTIDNIYAHTNKVHVNPSYEIVKKGAIQKWTCQLFVLDPSLLQPGSKCNEVSQRTAHNCHSF